MQTVETLNEGLKRAYKITIPAKDIDARIDKELKTVAPRVRMPGFRPGKVPANLVRKMHGPALEQGALEGAVQDSVQQLIKEQKLRPTAQPSVELEGGGPGKDTIVKVELETLPELPAPRIEGLKLERLIVEPTEEEVERALQQLLGGQKSFDPAPAKYAAQTGDLVIMDFEGKVDGVAFEGGKGEGMSIELGSGRLIPGFEDQLVGAKANQQKIVNVTFPDDYNVEALRGKAAVFDVTINEVQKPREAKADDAFAQSMGLEGIAQLRELLKGQVEQELAGLTRTHMKRKLLDQLAAGHEFEVPPSMVEAEFNQIWKQIEAEASREADPKAARAQMGKEREEYHAIAERRVRLGLLLSEIGTRNGVEISQTEMNKLIMQAAQQYRPQDRQRFVDYVRKEPMAAAQLRAPLFEDKVVDYLFDKAEISERKTDRATLEAEIESEDTHVHGPDCDHDHDRGHAPAAAPKAKKAAAGKAKAKPAAAAEAVTEEKAPAKKGKKAEAAPAEASAAVEKPAKAKPPRAKAAAAAEPVAAAEAAAKPEKKPRAKKA